MPDEVAKLEDHSGGVVLRRELTHLHRDVIRLVRHTVVLVLTLISIGLIHMTLSYFLGPNASFFNVIPIRYVIDIIDICVLGKFALHAIKNFKSDEKNY